MNPTSATANRRPRVTTAAAIAPVPRTEPLRQRVYRQLRDAIEAGSLAPGARLPASREHAGLLAVSRNTVLWAVERLQAEGYLVARVGDGTYVADRAAAPAGARRPGLDAHQQLSRRGRLIAETGLRWPRVTGPALPFRPGRPALEEFPFDAWQRLERRTTARARIEAAGYADPAGHPALRAAIAQWLFVSRGVRCAPGQVLITAGAQQGLDLVTRLLLDVGDQALIEDPGYGGTRAVLAAQGAIARPVRIDAEGLDIAHGAAQWPQARLAVVTPTHQFPLGVCMSLERRRALIDWARTSGGWIVEDDYDGEFQYGPHRSPALCSMAHDARVIYAGTFSKSLGGGLRIGFLVLPDALVDAFSRARALSDRQSPGALQEVLARFIADGYLTSHLHRMRELYARRQAFLIDALARATHGAITLAPSRQGMHLAFEIPSSQRDTALSQRAAEGGLQLAPISAYCVEARRRGWLFGYAGFDEATLQRAARSLGRLMR